MQPTDTSLLQSTAPIFASMDKIMEAVNIMNRIEVAIKGKADFTSLSINTALQSGVPVRRIIEQLKEQAIDPRSFGPLAELLGVGLTNEIKAF